MDIAPTFKFRPLSNRVDIAEPASLALENPLGSLAFLIGTWQGTGFNTIWRPLNDPAAPQQKHFLELNRTVERIEFRPIDGPIPNRGLLQQDLVMFGIHYLQQVSDNFGNGLHLEPGVWLNLPATSAPPVGPSVVRMGSIPHGTSIVAQGQVSDEAGAPHFARADITPFVIGQPDQLVPFPESDLSVPTPFRSEPALIAGITQAMVDDPNSVLQAALAGQAIGATTNLVISTAPVPILGGGTANTAFLQGDAAGPNADAVQMTAIFWLEQVEEAGQMVPQLQYTQTVLLDFNGLSWPHVSVATLRQVA